MTKPTRAFTCVSNVKTMPDDTSNSHNGRMDAFSTNLIPELARKLQETGSTCCVRLQLSWRECILMIRACSKRACMLPCGSLAHECLAVLPACTECAARWRVTLAVTMCRVHEKCLPASTGIWNGNRCLLGALIAWPDPAQSQKVSSPAAQLACASSQHCGTWSFQAS